MYTFCTILHLIVSIFAIREVMIGIDRSGSFDVIDALLIAVVSTIGVVPHCIVYITGDISVLWYASGFMSLLGLIFILSRSIPLPK